MNGRKKKKRVVSSRLQIGKKIIGPKKSYEEIQELHYGMEI